MIFRTIARFGALLVVALGLFVFRPAANAQLAPGVDNNDGPFGVDVQTLFHGPALKTEGVEWTMIDFRWTSMETGSQGNYDFADTDKIVDYYSNLGFHQIYVLQLATPCPLYASDMGRPNRIIDAIARWGGAVAAHYKGRGLTYEIGNEPEVFPMGGFWNNPDTYTRMARETAKAIKAADPGAKVMVGAVAWMDKPYLTRCFQDGLLADGTVDYVSFHGYHRDDIMPESGLSRDVKWLRDQIAQHDRGSDVQVVDSECSYGLAPFGAPKRFDNWTNVVYTEDEQAAYLARHYLTEIRLGIPIIIWYKDMHGENGHSLWPDAENSPRGLYPSGYVFRNLAQLLPNLPSTEIHGMPEVIFNGKEDSKNIQYMTYFRALADGKRQLVIALWNPIEAFDGKILQSRVHVGINMIETWRPILPSDPVSIPVTVGITYPGNATAETYNLLAKTPDEMTAPLAIKRHGRRLSTAAVDLGPMPTVIVVNLD